jgi:hypothetical protein
MGPEEKMHILFVLAHQVQEGLHRCQVCGLLPLESHLHRFTVQAEAETYPG